jgi:hypothetical protein
VRVLCALFRYYEQNGRARAPDSHELRDVPRRGALSLLQKPLEYRGIRQNSRLAFFVVGLGPVATRARVLIHEVLDRGAQAVARGAARCGSQVFDCGAQADVRGAA